jgi:hypothetical protein
VPKNSNRRNDVRRANKDRRSRLDEMRRQQRAVERRKNFLTFGSAIAVALILVGTAVWLAVAKAQANDAKKNRVSNQLKAESKDGHQSAPTAAEAKDGCLGVHTDPLSKAAQHFTTPIDYSKEKYGDTADGDMPIPPSGGRHNPVSLGDTNRFYPLSEKPRPERAVHNLEHGYVVVWYDSKLPAAQVQLLQAMAQDPSMSRLLIVGWWQSDLPSDKHVVMTSWGKTERCSSLDTAVARNFYTVHVNAPQAPEAGLGAISGADSIPPGTLPNSNTPAMSGSPSPPATPNPTSTKK